MNKGKRYPALPTSEYLLLFTMDVAEERHRLLRLRREGAREEGEGQLGG